MRRLTFAWTLIAAHLASGCGYSGAEDASGHSGAADPAEPVRIRVVDGVNMDVRDVPLLMAFDELRARGYLVEATYIAGNTLLADALARGDAEFGIINNQTAWSAIASGADIRTISEFTVYTGLVAAPTRIASCRDLHRRPVAIPVTTGFSPLMFRLFMTTECPTVEPEILVIAESQSRTTALIAGRIDAAVVPGEELLRLQQMAPGRFHAMAVPASRFPRIKVDGLQVRRQWAEEHPDAVKALIAAQLRIYRLIRADRNVLYDEAVKRLSLDRATAVEIADAHLDREIWDVNGGLTRENVQATIDLLFDEDAIPSRLAVGDVAELSYLRDVLAEIGQALP